MSMTFGSLFAGIGGFDLGLEHSGFRCLWQAEKDEACRRVLASHWPKVKRINDVRKITSRQRKPALVCGGFPCQDLSVAGKRAGLAGERSGLFHEFVRVLGALTPQWVLIENVPGLLSSNDGKDMGTVLGALGQLGYGWAYRVLDAQYDGVPQRRRRVFIVGCLGDAARAAAVLFEPESCDGHSPPSREAGPRVAACLRSRSAKPSVNEPGRGGEDDSNLVMTPARAVGTRRRHDPNGETLITHALTAEGCDAGEDGTGRGTPLVTVFNPHRTLQPDGSVEEGFAERDVTDAMHGPTGNKEPLIVQSIAENQRGERRTAEVAPSLNSGGGKPGRGYSAISTGMTVRRLTPRECERLQGFPDDWTAGEKDTARYRMLGNAVCVPVVEWIGRRIVAAKQC